MEQILNGRGEWWIPEKPEEALYGELYVSDNFFYLKVEESRPDHSEKKWYRMNQDIILGRIGSIFVTLNGCMTDGRGEGDLKNVHIEKYHYDIKYIFKGDHFNKIQDIELKKISIHFNNIENWMRNSKISMKDDECICYKKYAKEEFELENMKLDIVLKSNINRNYKESTASVKETVEIVMTSKIKKSYFELEKDVTMFRDFLTFAMKRRVSILHINIYFKNKEFHEDKIEVFSFQFYDSTIEKKDQGHMFFTYPKIKNNFETIINNWFKKYEEFETLFQIYFVNEYNKSYLESVFIAYTQALESYVRKKLEFKTEFLKIEEYIPIKKELKGIVDKLVADVDHNDSLKKKIEYGNEYSLRKMLKIILGDINNLEIMKELVFKEGLEKKIKTIKMKNAINEISEALTIDDLKENNLQATQIFDKIDNILKEQKHLNSILPLHKESDHAIINKIHRKNKAKYEKNEQCINQILTILKTDKETLINQGTKELRDKIVDVRNYYTHFPKPELPQTSNEPPVTINKLLFLTKELKIIIEICILKELEFSDYKINQISDNSRYNFLLTN
ncbi:MAG: hypothetical protein FWH54_00545 [Methanobrevibacter sp.]|nr:hypothetical protein [Methanobrevibacter sp.]